MTNRTHSLLFSNNLLVVETLLVLTLTLSGCSKSENTECCQDIFTSSTLLSHRRQQNSPDNGATLSQSDATSGDGTSSAKIASSTTPQALDPDGEPLIYKVLDRFPGVDIDHDGSFTYTPSQTAREAAAATRERFEDTFEVIASDDSPFHLHGLGGLLDLFGNRDTLPITVPIHPR